MKFKIISATVDKMQLIENTENLKAFCLRMKQQKFVCIDLEFLREHTYFAKLCLIQAACITESAIIDPLAEGIDLQSFFELMQDSSVTKVFHSGRQDIEIIFNLSGQIPAPLFDTQIAAQAAGFGEAASYESLVSHILHIELDKSSRLSDWSRRPLNETQLNYALSDVTHLVKIYQYLYDQLEKKNRLGWIAEELQMLENPSLYTVNPRDAWQRIRHRSHNALFLTTLRELAAWREQRAIIKNTPRQSFIKDEALLNICAARPCTKEELAGVRGIRADIASGKIGEEITGVIKKVKQLDKSDYVTPPCAKELPNVNTSLLELIRLLLKIVAQEQKITPRLLASDDDLKIFCHDPHRDVPFLHGWRYEIFGAAAEKICRGETAIAYNPQQRRFDFIDTSK